MNRQGQTTQQPGSEQIPVHQQGATAMDTSMGQGQIPVIQQPAKNVEGGEFMQQQSGGYPTAPGQTSQTGVPQSGQQSTSTLYDPQLQFAIMTPQQKQAFMDDYMIDTINLQPVNPMAEMELPKLLNSIAGVRITATPVSKDVTSQQPVLGQIHTVKGVTIEACSTVAPFEKFEGADWSLGTDALNNKSPPTVANSLFVDVLQMPAPATAAHPLNNPCIHTLCYSNCLKLPYLILERPLSTEGVRTVRVFDHQFNFIGRIEQASGLLAKKIHILGTDDKTTLYSVKKTKVLQSSNELVIREGQKKVGLISKRFCPTLNEVDVYFPSSTTLQGRLLLISAALYHDYLWN